MSCCDEKWSYEVFPDQPFQTMGRRWDLIRIWSDALLPNASLNPGIKAAPVHGGELGIRTLETLLEPTHFPGVRLRPLGQLSMFSQALSYRPNPGFVFQEHALWGCKFNPSFQIQTQHSQKLPWTVQARKCQAPHSSGQPPKEYRQAHFACLD